jgi:hypothetical protein
LTRALGSTFSPRRHLRRLLHRIRQIVSAARAPNGGVAGPFHPSVNPSEAEQFETFACVYHKLVLVAPWGKITVSGGDALISTDFKTLTIAAPSSPTSTTLQQRGWTLHLAAGAKVVPGPKKSGSYLVLPPQPDERSHAALATQSRSAGSPERTAREGSHLRYIRSSTR